MLIAAGEFLVVQVHYHFEVDAPMDFSSLRLDVADPAELPAGGYATPATYTVDGRQYVVIAAGGGKMGTASGDAYVAFSLPQ